MLRKTQPEGKTASTSAGTQPSLAHALTIDEALESLGSQRSGLPSPEVSRRLERYGKNELPRPTPPGLLILLLRQFKSPLIYVLLAAALVSLLLGDLSDAGFILLVLSVNATIGAVQESRAARSASALNSLIVAHAHVLRDGEEREIASEDIVPGDIVVLESGARVPADLRLVSGGLEVDESLLTGESVPVTKHPNATLAREAGLADRTTMAFAATIVTKGRGYGVAVATGTWTEVGRIAASMSGADAAKPPLLQRMEVFTRNVAIAVGCAVLLLGAISFLRGASIHEVFMSSVALAVAVIPEGLPIAMTVALAIAVSRMSRRKVITRRLAAVEALGSCTFIASDKTGTLTLNELTVQRVLIPTEKPWQVPSEPEVPLRTSERVADLSNRGPLERLCRAAILCNDATLVLKDGEWKGHGDAVDLALLRLGEQFGLSRAAAEANRPRLGAIPFEAERQYAATLNDTPDGPRLFVKGAGERVLAMCTRMATPRGEIPLEREAIETEVHALAAAGYRMLAVAEGPGLLLPNGDVDSSTLTGLVFLGFVGMIDPLRPEARDAIQACRGAGIEVAMVTGDHPVTAQAIARELGLLGDRERVVTGRELKVLAESSEAEFDELVAHTRVFARVEPQQKLDIVQSLIRKGHFVAVTGDGANDAPAMRAANIGVAMGKRGTDVARETGELILADDNFASIVAGVEEGRIAYGNVRKVVFLLISTGAGLLVLFLGAMLWGLPLPFFPVQLLWLNLVTNGVQDVALAFEPGEGGELTRRPRSPKESVIDGLMLWRTVLSALVMGGVCLVTFWWMLDQNWEIEVARNALLLLMVLFQNVQAGNARSERRSLFALSPLRNPFLFAGTVAAQLLHIGAMYTPGLRDVLRVSPVSLPLWLSLFGLALLLFIVMELDKALRARKAERESANVRITLS